MLNLHFRALRAILFRNSIKFQSSPIHHKSLNTQLLSSKSHYSKLTSNDTQVLSCLSRGDFHEARNLLDEMPQRGPNGRISRWTSMLSRFCKDGFIDEAKTLFEIIPERNLVTYNAMLSGFVQSGRLWEARSFFDEMPVRNVVSWTSMLCGLMDAGIVHGARVLFDEMPDRNVVSWNAMVVGLIRNGCLEEARQVFSAMPVRNIVSWNTMIAGYAENSYMEEARALFDEMEVRNVITWTSMVSGYCRSGNVVEGYAFFERMPEKNIVSWTAMIGGLVWNGLFEEALLLFLRMRSSHLLPNGETLISLTYGCCGIGYSLLGEQVHALSIVNGWDSFDYDGRLSKSLIHMYSMLGLMESANSIFVQNLEKCSVESYNSMINGYIWLGQVEKARQIFDIASSPNQISWTSMIDGYLSIGEVSKACHLFNKMPHRDGIAWTAMISGLVHNELFLGAINMFLKMRAQGICPLAATYSVLIGAAGALANLDQGRQYHCLLVKSCFDLDLILQNSLISMYAKCGEIADAYRVFSNMRDRDLISWNSMIMGFSNHGLMEETLQLLEDMVKSGTLPNSVTFLGILSACSHAGLVEKGTQLFDAMNQIYGVQPRPEHYACMIDLFGRAGKVKEAEAIVLQMPLKPDSSVWGTLLGVCGLGGNYEIGRHAAQVLLKLDPLNAPAHVVLCNLYAGNNQHVEEKLLRKEMGMKGVKKVPGCSWILLKGEVQVFLSGQTVPPTADEILSLIFRVGTGESITLQYL